MNDSNLPSNPAIDFFFSSLSRMMWISKVLGKNKPKESIKDGSVNLVFQDENSLTQWYFLIENWDVTIIPGNLKDAQSTLEITPKAFCRMLRGDLDYSTAWMTGKIRVIGEANYMFIMAFIINNFRKARNAVGWRGFLRRRFTNKVLKKIEQLNL